MITKRFPLAVIVPLLLGLTGPPPARSTETSNGAPCA
jgi:hypothetical protein